jgi:hypothetical protein
MNEKPLAAHVLGIEHGPPKAITAPPRPAACDRGAFKGTKRGLAVLGEIAAMCLPARSSAADR